MGFLNSELQLEVFRFPLGELFFPGEECSSKWIGHGTLLSKQRLAWDFPTLGIVSSHSEFSAFASAEWQTKLIAALRLAKQQGYRILFAKDTPYSLAIRTACASLGVAAIELVVANHEKPSTSVALSEPTVRQTDRLLSVELRIDCNSNCPEFRQLPIHDRAVVALSRFLFALEIRPKGRMAELIDLRLQDPTFPQGSVILAIRYDQSGTKKRIRSTAKAWLDKGIIGWFCHSELVDDSNLMHSFRCHAPGRNTEVPIFLARQWKPLANKFLIHCTRARRGPWPDQSIDQFHDEILESPWKCHPTAMDSLTRILEKQRLVATNALKPGTKATVSFSACSLQELVASRRFESHLARWDWEPYGMMISAKWLVSLGCQEVRYCSKSEMKSLSEEHSTFAQVYSDSGNGRDWRVEREWRIADDVRLNRLPFSQGAIFVSSMAEARSISHLSRWPICVVE